MINAGGDKIHEMIDRFAAIIICNMLGEQLFQLPGHLSFRLILLFGLVCVLTMRSIHFQRGLWILVLAGGSYAFTAYFSGRG